MSFADRGRSVEKMAANRGSARIPLLTRQRLFVFGAAVITLHILQETFLGTTASGSFIANGLQICCALVAAAACFLAIRRGTGFTRPFWFLIGLSFIVWSAADAGWMYYQSYLHAPPARDSILHFIMGCRSLFVAMALLLDQNEENPRYYFDLASLLDMVQLFIIFVLIYVGWYYVPSVHGSRGLSMLRSDQIGLGKTFGVLGLAALQMIRARTVGLRRLYGGLLVCVAPLSAGIALTDYRELRLSREIFSGTWLDLWWTVPFLLTALWAANWEQSADCFVRPNRDQTFVRMLFANTIYAGGPLIVLLQAVELGPGWRGLTLSLVGISIVCFGARLALSKFRENNAALRVQVVNDALVESEARFRTLIEEAPLAVGISRNAKTLWVNRVYLDLFGYERAEEIVGRSIGEMLSPECREEVEERARVRSRGLPVSLNYEAVGLRKDGTRFDAQFDVASVNLPDGPATISFLADISERKRSEAALHGSEQRYRMLFEKTVAGVGIIALDGCVIDCNDAWARMFAYKTAVECRGSQIQDHYRDPAERTELLGELTQNGFFVNLEWELQRKDGSPLWVLLNSVMIRDLDGEPLIQCTMSDITARKRAEEALREAKEFSET